eukprot:238085-Hanusia_phi.AAC.4
MLIFKSATSAVSCVIALAPGMHLQGLILLQVKKFHNSDAPDVIWISKSIGPLIYDMWKDIDCEASVLLLNFILSLPLSSSTEVRTNLAFNLPGIILTVSDSTKLESIKSAPEKRMVQDKVEKIRCIPEMLCKDEDSEVRDERCRVTILYFEGRRSESTGARGRRRRVGKGGSRKERKKERR